MTAHEKLVIVRQLLCEVRNEKPEIGFGSEDKTILACHINTIRAIANQVLYAYYPEIFDEKEAAN